MVKVYCVSDIHTDFKANMAYIQTLPVESDSILIVCGDISDNIKVIEDTLNLLNIKYPTGVFFIPGNHELWCGRSDQCTSSMEKLEVIYEICKKTGTFINPTKINNDLAIFPMLGWYHPSFDEDWCKLNDELKVATYDGLYHKWGDFRHSKWDIPHIQVAERFLQANEKLIHDFKQQHQQSYPSKVISFSHFVPRRELLPPRSQLLKDFLPLVVGSVELDTQLRSIGSTVHQ
ncbi:hypothetical protein PPL_02011 [Heterostelium album PN500]|uniref:Calcineurin-like phosphoesterase domain-containing protein n=1 Tax=Heterostelium pallidum (strain ATCC 26659 / Pp 5 / PN500) TaxID=670386 RepID=D3B142_HETP5|nr:hypothetical protein PPL_02011 [Heterostelium album PN500]EFA85016.1 hypothetical protein PPL_02011 [Heterostelium album PN500]|eukprot:XP_020437126.1 hypothetical protein PPL_02011 [Heterostelium album PN500]